MRKLGVLRVLYRLMREVGEFLISKSVDSLSHYTESNDKFSRKDGWMTYVLSNLRIHNDFANSGAIPVLRVMKWKSTLEM